MTTIIRYKVKQPTHPEYLSGYAAGIEIGEGRILLRDRRLPSVQFQDGKPVEIALPLGDLELPADGDSGWAAWGFAMLTPAWWGRSAVEAPAAADAVIAVVAD